MLGGSGAYDSSPEKKIENMVRFGAFWCIFRRDCIILIRLSLNNTNIY